MGALSRVASGRTGVWARSSRAMQSSVGMGEEQRETLPEASSERVLIPSGCDVLLAGMSTELCSSAFTLEIKIAIPYHFSSIE